MTRATKIGVALLLAGGLAWLGSRETSQTASPTPDSALHRTRTLVAHKTRSLQAYNEATPAAELLARYEQTLGGRPVRGEAFAALSRRITTALLPQLWREAQTQDSPLVRQAAISQAIDQRFSPETLPNGDVILFATDPNLRVVVSEALQDAFRDTGWHWRWIGDFIESLPATDAGGFKDLDVYAAEELSEFLSVLGVAAVLLSDRHNPVSALAGAAPIDPSMIDGLFARIESHPRRAHDGASPSPGGYSEQTKRALVGTLPEPMFREVTEEMGLDHLHRPNPELQQRRADLEVPLGIAGGGASSADFDADGDPDVYLAGDAGGVLYRNEQGTRFEDVTDTAGLQREGESRAGYFVDYDNDGDLDLYVTFVQRDNRLYRNEGDGRFVDVTADVGLGGHPDITHGAVWFDMDNDGLLDLYTAHFGAWTEGAVPTLGRLNVNAGPNRLYRQRLVDGAPHFDEVGADLGVDDRGWTHCVGAWDYDQDGFMDLISLNDFGASLVFHNLQGRGFEETSRALRLDATYNAMNFTLLDLDHSGRPAIYITGIMKLVHDQRYRKPTESTPVIFSAENLRTLRALNLNQLFAAKPDGTYRDVHGDRVEPMDLGWSWDASAFDYENDGDLDLLVLNGTEHETPTLPDENRMRHVNGRAFLSQYSDQSNVCYLSEGGYFYNVSNHCPMAYVGHSRGSSFLDFDGDGDLDVVISDYNGPVRLFRNEQRSHNHWVRLALEATHGNRGAIGARVQVHFGDQTRHDQVVSGSGFLSQNPAPLHFGLGTAEQIDRALIIWPSGARQELSNLAAGQTHRIRQTP